MDEEDEFEVGWIQEEPYRECTRLFSSEERADAFCKKQGIQNYQLTFYGWN